MSSLKGVHVTWLGHATVLVRTDRGTNILIDPFVQGNPMYPKQTELPEKIPYILVTHGHPDHMGDVVPMAGKYDSTVVAVFELAAYLESKGVKKTIGMNLGGTVQLGDVAVTMVDAKHSAGVHDEQGTHYAGVATGFVLTVTDGSVLYYAGDTCVFGDMRLIHELYAPDAAMLPIGGHFTMGPKEASLAIKLLEPKIVLPIHFGTFPPLAGTPEQLAKQAGTDVRVISWKPGETF